MKLSNETQGLVSCLQSCNDLYEQVEDAVVARCGSDRVAEDILSAQGGFREKWLAMCEVLKGQLADAMFENICEKSEEL